MQYTSIIIKEIKLILSIFFHAYIRKNNWTTIVHHKTESENIRLKKYKPTIKENHDHTN